MVNLVYDGGIGGRRKEFRGDRIAARLRGIAP